MKDNSLTFDNAKFAIVSVFAVIAVSVIYKATQGAKEIYSTVDNVIGDAINPAATAFSEWYVGDGVELTEFNVSRLYRDFFDEQWVIKPDVLKTLDRAYPDEIRSILDSENKLYEQYRSQISGLDNKEVVAPSGDVFWAGLPTK